ncbi:uncharacterized protein DDB_G0287625 [Condylostylus longicornis]|uniref:uncharacterized protein DDB_G0287625 n=1 Tax=Condylostylus longicornis TaxID=2530218 RepID=UPI00244D9AA2|nr:uncharacterized protein DDB_G0287625 [Condylostylus longicornis]XP_055377562.1 uncharacterized protein DDB_G0287625 [Condylostylus longicornis]
MEPSPSVNRIHVNNSTGLSLNARFTAMQSLGSTTQQKQKKRSRSASRFLLSENGSVANRKFLQQLEKKHKMETALKLKRRSLKAGIQRGGRSKNVSALALRLAPNGKIIKARSLANVATMKADLVQPVAPLQRSNSGLNLGGRVGLPRRINRRRSSQIGISPQGGRRMRLRRNNNIPNNSINQVRGRSRSRSRNRQRSNSISNLTRRNIAMNITQQQNQQQQRRARSRSRSRGRLNTNRNVRSTSQSRSVHSRLGIKRVPVQNKNVIRGLNRRRGIGRVARGRITKRMNSTGGASISNSVLSTNQNGMKRQGRSRSRSRIRNSVAVQGQRGRSRSRARSRSIKRGGKIQTKSATVNRRGRSRSRGRGGRGPTRGGNNNTKREDIKKEDLDKELDQYMASSNNDNDL